MKGYDLSPLDNHLLQFARMLTVINETDLTDTKKAGIAGLLGMDLDEVNNILAYAKQTESDLTTLPDEGSMVTRRSCAVINGDRNFTVNYDDGVEVVATDGRALYNIDLSTNGSIEVNVNGCVKHKDVMLDDHLVIEPKGYGRVVISRKEY